MYVLGSPVMWMKEKEGEENLFKEGEENLFVEFKYNNTAHLRKETRESWSNSHDNQ